MTITQEEDRFTNTVYLYTDPDSYTPLARIDTDLRPLLTQAERKITQPSGQAAAPDIQVIDLRHLLPADSEPPQWTPDPLPAAATAAGGKHHWGALTKTNRTTLTTRIYYFHCELNGAPEALTDTTGEIVWSLTQKAWGSPLHEEDHNAFLTPQNLRFQGQYLDRETGLHYNTFRYYDPHIGRFTTPDPIGLDGGINLYQYAPNPLTWIDPWGWACHGNSRRSTKQNHVYVIFNKKTGEVHKFGISGGKIN